MDKRTLKKCPPLLEQTASQKTFCCMLSDEKFAAKTSPATSVTVFPVIHIGFLNLFKMANDLSFQEFPVDVDDASGSMNDLEMAISMDGTNPSNDNTNKQSFWSIDYYRQLFDVDTDKVIHRLLYSMVPRLNSNYVTQNIRPNPDLYGPFWISLTLLFTTAISNQLGNLFAFDVNRTHGVVNFRMITLLAGVVFFYVFMFPLLLLVFSWWRKVTDMYTLVEVICAYGYSLTIYIPITLLWAIRIDWLRWILAFFGLFLSGSVLVISLWPVVRKYKYMACCENISDSHLLHLQQSSIQNVSRVA
ncbi:Protein YIPF1 [Trichinella patagoniensis]|uniref:Protein YIPF n=1 Tax=Trichinella patagoniensis TaxID=990121 RepID=A0A0V0ZZ03_9BILA|nr:Protein YIPF1 [Trichinella patagoniensis]